MQGLAILLAATSLGVDYGWQPAEDGNLEYIIQIEPELIAALQKGEAIISEIDPEVRNVRRFRIQIGSGPVPRISKPSSPLPTDSSLLSPKGSALPPATPPSSKGPRNSTFQLTVEAPSEPTASVPADPSAPSSFPGTTFPLAGNQAQRHGVATEPAPLAPPPVLPVNVLSQKRTVPETKLPAAIPDPDRQNSLPTVLEDPSSAPPLKRIDATKTTRHISPTRKHPSQQAAFHQTADPSRSDATSPTPPSPTSATKPPTHHPARPWLLFSLTAFGLLASLGANAYLGYLLFGIHGRYQELRRGQPVATG